MRRWTRIFSRIGVRLLAFNALLVFLPAAGVLFLDMGNAFAEEDYNLFDVTEWRYGTGAGIQWFSPFGPLALILGFPLDKLSVEDSPVFEFSVGGGAF